MDTFSTYQLLSSLVDVVDALRSVEVHRKCRINLAAVTAADYEVKTLCSLAEWVGLDLTGIPLYRVNGEVRGMSPRTRLIHLEWIVADVLERLDLSNPWVYRVLFAQRSHSVSVSPEAASIMLSLRDDVLDDEFAEFRADVA